MTDTQLAFLDVEPVEYAPPTSAPQSVRFSPPGGRCAASCPMWRRCRVQQYEAPDAVVACEVGDDVAGIDPTRLNGGNDE